MNSLTITVLLVAVHAVYCWGQDPKMLEKKLDDPSLTVEERIETLNLLSRNLTYVNPGKSLEYANAALKLATSANNSLAIANAFRNLAGVYSYHESYFTSMDYLHRALDIFNSVSDSAGIANCYISLGHTFRRLQKREEEIAYHKKAYDIFKRLNLADRIAIASHNLGESYFYVNDVEKSRALTEEAIRLNQSLNNLPVLSACYKVMGMIEARSGNDDKAWDHFQSVLAISDTLGHYSQKIATVEAMIQLAALSGRRNNSAAQLKYLKMAADFSEKHNLPNYLQVVHNELLVYFSGINDQRAVQRYVREYREVSDAINQRELEDRYQLAMNIVKVHELSKEKVQLEQFNATQEQQLQTRNMVLVVSAVSLLVLLALIMKIVTANRTLRRQKHTIEVQRQHLENLNKTKDKFFSIVAHDLKSPLNSLGVFAGLLVNGIDSLDKDQIKEMSKELQASVDNTIKMTDNLIRWASFQMKESVTKMEAIRLKRIVDNIFAIYKALAVKKNINLSYEVDHDLFIFGDPDQIEFVLRNLVNNAIKYTYPGGSVTVVAAAIENNMIRIAVADNGIGIPYELQAEIFAMGDRKSTRGTADEKGTGLGLTISYEFIKRNKGEIQVESEPGKGSVFTITLKGICCSEETKVETANPVS